VTVLTELEKKVVLGSLKSEYGSAAEDYIWMFSVVEHSGLTGKVARGVVSSLVKKGVAVVHNYEGEAGGPAFKLTEAGRMMAEELSGESCDKGQASEV